MPKPSSNDASLSMVDGIRNVVPQSGKIGEAQVEHLHVVLLHEFQDCLRIRLGVSHSELSFAPRQREGDVMSCVEKQ